MHSQTKSHWQCGWRAICRNGPCRSGWLAYWELIPFEMVQYTKFWLLQLMIWHWILTLEEQEQAFGSSVQPRALVELILRTDSQSGGSGVFLSWLVVHLFSFSSISVVLLLSAVSHHCWKASWTRSTGTFSSSDSNFFYGVSVDAIRETISHTRGEHQPFIKRQQLQVESIRKEKSIKHPLGIQQSARNKNIRKEIKSIRKEHHPQGISSTESLNFHLNITSCIAANAEYLD